MRGLYKACDWFGGDSKGISLDYGRILRSREEGVAGNCTPVRPTDGGSSYLYLLTTDYHPTIGRPLANYQAASKSIKSASSRLIVGS